jgi:hypothetical protein
LSSTIEKVSVTAQSKPMWPVAEAGHRTAGISEFGIGKIDGAIAILIGTTPPLGG